MGKRERQIRQVTKLVNEALDGYIGAGPAFDSHAFVRSAMHLHERYGVCLWQTETGDLVDLSLFGEVEGYRAFVNDDGRPCIEAKLRPKKPINYIAFTLELKP